MPWVHVTTLSPRDPAFRDTILRIYEYRCAVCGYDALLGSTDLGIEAAHIHWHSHGGPDTAADGRCLCTFHHKAFDRGAIGLPNDRQILVSQHVRGSHGFDEWPLWYVGKSVRAPQPGEPSLAATNLGWHCRIVFREPARTSSGPKVRRPLAGTEISREN